MLFSLPLSFVYPTYSALIYFYNCFCLGGRFSVEVRKCGRIVCYIWVNYVEAMSETFIEMFILSSTRWPWWLARDFWTDLVEMNFYKYYNLSIKNDQLSFLFWHNNAENTMMLSLECRFFIRGSPSLVSNKGKSWILWRDDQFLKSSSLCILQVFINFQSYIVFNHLGVFSQV